MNRLGKPQTIPAFASSISRILARGIERLALRVDITSCAVFRETASSDWHWGIRSDESRVRPDRQLPSGIGVGLDFGRDGDAFGSWHDMTAKSNRAHTPAVGRDACPLVLGCPRFANLVSNDSRHGKEVLRK